MLRRIPLFSTSFLIAAVAAVGLLTLSCGGGAGRETVAGPAPDAAPVAAGETGTLGTSAKPTMVQICHWDLTNPEQPTPYTLNLTQQGVNAHIPRHSGPPADTYGACSVCPCFSAAEVNSSSCDPYNNANCSESEWSLECDSGAYGARFITGFGRYDCAQPSDIDFLDWNTHSNITESEFQACYDLLFEVNGFCQ